MDEPDLIALIANSMETIEDQEQIEAIDWTDDLDSIPEEDRDYFLDR